MDDGGREVHVAAAIATPSICGSNPPSRGTTPSSARPPLSSKKVARLPPSSKLKTPSARRLEFGTITPTGTIDNSSTPKPRAVKAYDNISQLNSHLRRTPSIPLDDKTRNLVDNLDEALKASSDFYVGKVYRTFQLDDEMYTKLIGQETTRLNWYLRGTMSMDQAWGGNAKEEDNCRVTIHSKTGRLASKVVGVVGDSRSNPRLRDQVVFPIGTPFKTLEMKSMSYGDKTIYNIVWEEIVCHGRS